MKKHALLAALLMAASGVVMAGTQQSMSGQGDMAYQKLDANGDGYVSPQEATANPKLAAQFDKLDRNGDAKLDQAEFARFETKSE